jgi:triosephosphate isomerase
VRNTVIAANWKMHKLRGEAMEYASELSAWIDEHLGDEVPSLHVVVAPSYTCLEQLVEQQPPFGVFAQNMHQADQGAYTGEISPAMLRDIGAHGVILGHSERRQYFAETDESLAEKVQAALAFALRPMLCVGETLEQRKAGQAEQVVAHQLRVALAGVDAQAALPGILTVAYEPVWAIGTGETATPEIAQQMHAFIRTVLVEVLGDEQAAQSVSLLYGGSVKPDNAAELLGQPDIDGALIGGAGLEVDSFTAVLEHARARVASLVG